MSEVGEQVYKSIGARDLKIDIFRPSVSVDAKAFVILVHGGGWVAGHRSIVAGLAQTLADRGYIVGCPEYRLVGEARWPAQIEDVSAVVRWAASQAMALGVASGRVVVGGCSAGGHLALMATLDTLGDAKPAAVVSLFAASDLTVGREAPKGAFDATPLVGPDASEDALAAVTPLRQINAQFPPALIMHGGADWLIDPVASVDLYTKFCELGVTAELHVLAAGNHDFTSEPTLIPVVADAIDLFLTRIVIAPEAAAAEGVEHNPLFGRGQAAFEAFRAEMNKKMAAQAAGQGTPDAP